MLALLEYPCVVPGECRNRVTALLGHRRASVPPTAAATRKTRAAGTAAGRQRLPLPVPPQPVRPQVASDSRCPCRRLISALRSVLPSGPGPSTDPWPRNDEGPGLRPSARQPPFCEVLCQRPQQAHAPLPLRLRRQQMNRPVAEVPPADRRRLGRPQPGVCHQRNQQRIALTQLGPNSFDSCRRQRSRPCRHRCLGLVDVRDRVGGDQSPDDSPTKNALKEQERFAL